MKKHLQLTDTAYTAISNRSVGACAFTLAESGQRPHLDLVFGRCAFTLAETLIALAVIGIVAAMTIPGIVQKYQEKARVVALKKFYSTFSQAINMTIATTGTEFTSTDLLKNIKTEKICEQSYTGCTKEIRKKMVGNSTLSWGPNDWFLSKMDYAKLIGGEILRINRSFKCSSTDPNNNYCGEISVDVNGDLGPNRAGYDVFYFYVYSDKGVMPFGLREDTRTPFSLCADKSGYGYECTAWVIENENFDYLHCDDLSWSGKKSCKE